MAKKKSKKNVRPVKKSDAALIKERAKNLALDKCYITSDWNENKVGHLLVTRKHSNENVTYAFFLIDLALYGIKDASYKFNASSLDVEEIIENDYIEFDEISYDLAHNIVYASLEWAEDFGFGPHKGWEVAQYIMEEDTEDIPLLDVECGIDGKPAIFEDTARVFLGDIKTLEETAGRGNYQVFYEEEEDEEDEDLEEYDDGLNDSIVEEIIEDDIEAFRKEIEKEESVEGSSDDKFQHHWSLITGTSVINKLYYEHIGASNFEDIDLINYTVNDKDIELNLPVNEAEEAFVEGIAERFDTLQLPEILEALEKYPYNIGLYILLLEGVYRMHKDNDEGFLDTLKDCCNRQPENLALLGCLLVEESLSNTEGFYKRLSDTGFYSRVLHYDGEIPVNLFIVFCAVHMQDELLKGNVDEADIFYYAARIFTGLGEHPTLFEAMKKLVMVKYDILEEQELLPEELMSRKQPNLKIAYKKE